MHFLAHRRVLTLLLLSPYLCRTIRTFPDTYALERWRRALSSLSPEVYFAALPSRCTIPVSTPIPSTRTAPSLRRATQLKWSFSIRTLIPLMVHATLTGRHASRRRCDRLSRLGFVDLGECQYMGFYGKRFREAVALGYDPTAVLSLHGWPHLTPHGDLLFRGQQSETRRKTKPTPTDLHERFTMAPMVRE